LNVGALTTGGVYTVTVGSAAGTGGYTVQVLLNAAYEEEAHGGPRNKTTPQDVGGPVTPPPNGASPGAGRGRAATARAPDLYSFTVGEGQRVTLALKGSIPGVGLELQDSTGTTLPGGVGVGGSTNVDRIVYNVGPLPAGTYWARVSGSAGVDYSLVI